MIIIASLVISFLIVCLINFGARHRRQESMIRDLLWITQHMENFSSSNPEGMIAEDHAKFGLLIKEAENLANKTERALIILLARKMSNVYDSLKVRNVSTGE